mgnify:CR=1 FL=1
MKEADKGDKEIVEVGTKTYGGETVKVGIVPGENGEPGIIVTINGEPVAPNSTTKVN